MPRRIRKSKVDKNLDDMDIAFDDPRLCILNKIKDYALIRPNSDIAEILEDTEFDLAKRGKISADHYRLLQSIYFKIRDIKF